MISAVGSILSNRSLLLEYPPSYILIISQSSLVPCEDKFCEFPLPPDVTHKITESESMRILLLKPRFTHSFLFLLFLCSIFSVKVAIIIEARPSSLTESIYNVKNTNLHIKRLALVFENKITFIFIVSILNSFYIKLKMI